MRIIKKKIVFIKTEKDYNTIYYYNESIQENIAEKNGP